MIIPVSTYKAHEQLSYDIVLENNALQYIAQHLALQGKVLLVSDTGVPKKYQETLISQLERAGVYVCVVIVEQGEASKSFSCLQRILQTMLEAHFSRNDAVVALGGGVVGDLSGFAAATYMRGISFYNIPTTLLSQVDSSIGGKTAIDFCGLKNCVGAFWQPKKVVIDPLVLKTLDVRQLHAGLAEAIKMALTSNADLFSFIERTSKDTLLKELPHIIDETLRIKKHIVEEDPQEKGLRRILNFGHTIGHAIESKSAKDADAQGKAGAQGRQSEHGSSGAQQNSGMQQSAGALLHGECVALGMLPMCAPDVKERLCAVLETFDLPTHIDMTSKELLPYITHDKKAETDGIQAVFVPEVGKSEIKKVSTKEICTLFNDSGIGA